MALAFLLSLLESAQLVLSFYLLITGLLLQVLGQDLGYLPFCSFILRITSIFFVHATFKAAFLALRQRDHTVCRLLVLLSWAAAASWGSTKDVLIERPG